MGVVQCQGCREYVDKGSTVRLGIGRVCDTQGCKQAAVNRARESQRARNERSDAGRSRLAYVVNEKGTKRPGHGSQFRRRVRERDGGHCRMCQRKSKLQVHHIEYRSEGGRDVDHNGILLCDGCHGVVHSNKWFWQPLLRAVIWIHYVERLYMTVLQVRRRLAKTGMLPGPPVDWTRSTAENVS